MHVKTLIIDSRDKINASGLNYQFNLPFPLSGVKSIDLLSANFPQTNYNVNDSNNILYLNDGASKAIQLSNGNYDIYDFVDMIEQALNDASTINFTVTYSLVSMKLVITGDSNFVLEFSNTTDSVAYLMGFENLDTSSALSHVADYCLNLSVPMYYNILINELGYNVKSTNYNDNATFTVFNNSNNSDINLWANNSYHCQRIKILNDNIQNLNVRITERGNKDIDFNGCHWAIMLKLNYDC